MQNIRFRTYRKDDEELIIPFLEDNFKDWPNREYDGSKFDYYKWKHLDNPLKKNLIALAELDENIIGCIHRDFKNVKFGSSNYLSYFGGDVAVDKKQRGKGVWSKLLDYADKVTHSKYHPSISIGFTTNPIVKKKWKKNGRVFPHKINNMIYINDLDKHKNHSNIEGYKYIGYTVYKKLNQVTRRNYVRENEIKLEFINKFPESYTDFWAIKRGEFNFTFDRTREYMNWRYCDPRGGNYIVKSFSKNGVFLGYLVLKIDYKNESYPTGYIVDLLTATNNQDLSNYLILDALEYFESKSVNMVHSWVVEGNRNSRYLSNNGFLAGDNPWLVMYRKYSDAEEILQLDKSPGKSVYLSNGDADSF